MARPTLASIVRRQLGAGTVTFKNRVTAQIGVAVAPIARQSGNRLVLDIVNLSVNAIFVLDDPQVSSIRGYRIAPSGGTLHLRWDEDGERVGHEWFGVAAAAASDLLVYEVLVSTEREEA